MKYRVILLENNPDYVFCFPIVNSVHLVIKFSFQSIIAFNWNHTPGAMPVYELFEKVYRSFVASG